MRSTEILVETAFDLDAMAAIICPYLHSYEDADAIMGSVSSYHAEGLSSFLQRRYGASSSFCLEVAQDMLELIIANSFEQKCFDAIWHGYSMHWTDAQRTMFRACYGAYIP